MITPNSRARGNAGTDFGAGIQLPLNNSPDLVVSWKTFSCKDVRDSGRDMPWTLPFGVFRNGDCPLLLLLSKRTLLQRMREGWTK